MAFVKENYDVVVVGAGHAGCEAALACARLGLETILFTISVDSIAMMPCNPNIGGSSKGHLVREIDALGGEMGKNIDKTFIQSKMLNRSKGPAVHSLRAQADKAAYSMEMRKTLQDTEHLTIRQAEVAEIITDEENHITGVKTFSGATYECKAAVLCTGTYLNARCLYGDVINYTGPNGLQAATHLTDSLKEHGVEMFRFKTGTPARVLRSSIDFTDLEVQKGDEPVTPFSFDAEMPPKNSAVCYVSWTNDRTKQVILDNIHRSPLYAGMIEGVGPRYCPSIEDKIMRFSEKPRHQLFIEPCGAETEEMYLQGMSSSLPEEVQIAFYRTIKGLEHVEIMRNAYAIEYDCCDPLQLNATLEFRDYPGLYGAGQFNGSSGYEEAAAQGFVAGANAALKVLNRDPLILDRAGSYIGTLIDDLITKGVTDPYRMMTSRSEYRLVLRQDNADERLTPIGRKLGLIDDRRWAKFERKQAQKEAEMKRAEKTVFSPTDALNEVLVSCETSPVTTGVRLSELLRRPQVTYADLTPIDTERPNYPREIFESVETALKYEGYIKRQLQDIAEMRRLEKKLLPKEINYAEISGLRLEAQEKLNRVRPENVGQAGRISGVSPADISVLLIWLSAHNEEK